MLKAWAIFVLLIFILMVCAYLYFFGLYIQIDNRSTKINIDNLRCESSFGDSWAFQNIDTQSVSRNFITLGIGSTITCFAKVEGYPEKSIMVVGFFDQYTKSRSIVAVDGSDGLDFDVTELNQ